MPFLRHAPMGAAVVGVFVVGQLCRGILPNLLVSIPAYTYYIVNSKLPTIFPLPSALR